MNNYSVKAPKNLTNLPKKFCESPPWFFPDIEIGRIPGNLFKFSEFPVACYSSDCSCQKQTNFHEINSTRFLPSTEMNIE